MKVNDYVRTKNGNIRKIKEVIDKAYVDDPDYYVDKVLINIEQNRAEDTIYMEPFLYSEEIIKSSPNIIDLIEVGDYVNGSKVEEIEEYNGEKYLYLEEMEYSNANQDYINVYCKQEYIKSIVTKEQFKNIEYEVK